MNESRGPGTLTLMGSGELAASMSKVHRAVAARISGDLRPAVIDSPAGFEPNCADIAAKAVEYLERHLRATCDVASYRLSSIEDKDAIQRAIATLERANYIFAGPGSPTYAVRCWRGSQVLETMARRLAEGAQLVCASAAAIALGAYTLPVYEIFKAGAELHWVEGADLLAPYGIRLAVVPHWNNAEGGTFDTSCCFMGRERFNRLEALLDARTVALCIDEHTACTIDIASGQCAVTGIGGVTVRAGTRSSAHATGTSFALDELVSTPAQRSARNGPQATANDRRVELRRVVEAATQLVAGDRERLNRAAGPAFALASAIDRALDAGVDGDATDAARATLTGLVAAWSEELARQSGENKADVSPFVDLLISVRARLRSDGAWEAADAIRDGLAKLGITLEDTPRETLWRAT